ncbi:MAG: helix-turn-helix domain containing protein [Oscillospiraceae bacterium]|nr:helix-turn-helix domain containing protein [Oscillospiraceae bacterium]
MKEHEGERLPEKVEWMFQAVIDMISEDYDISTIKVADITRRAGIGKGTAYEYFQSKEELIGEALDWNFHRQMRELCQAVDKAQSFREKVYTVLDWMGCKVPSKKTFMEVITMISGRCHVNKGVSCRLKEGGYGTLICEALGMITEAGICEGIIRKELSEYQRQTGMLSQLFMFFLYIQRQTRPQEEQKDGALLQESTLALQEIKDETYENILRLYR